MPKSEASIASNPRAKRSRPHEKPSYNGAKTSVKMAVIHQDLLQRCQAESRHQTFTKGFSEFRLDQGTVMLKDCEDKNTNQIYQKKAYHGQISHI